MKISLSNFGEPGGSFHEFGSEKKKNSSPGEMRGQTGSSVSGEMPLALWQINCIMYEYIQLRPFSSTIITIMSRLTSCYEQKTKG